MRFDKELIDYEVEKITKRVADKLRARTETLRQHTENHHAVLFASPNLINFAGFLKAANNQTLTRWVLLNDCMREEHPAQQSLLDLTYDDVFFQGLASKYFSKQFLMLSQADRAELRSQFGSFKLTLKNSATSTFVMLNLATGTTWRAAVQAYLYFKDILSCDPQGKGQNTLILDALRVFVMEGLIRASYQISQKNV